MAKRHGKTRKIQKGFMTIPQLRKAFDHIETFTQSLLQSVSDTDDRRKAFQKEWMKVFHREVDDKSANAYLQFEEKKGTTKGKTKKQKGGSSVGPSHPTSTNQRGGSAPLAGAPLDYSTRPGIDGLYGTFPAYVSSGLAFYNDINKEAPLAGCGVENTTPKVPLSIGSNEVQKGGRRRTRKNSHQGGSWATTGHRGGAFPTMTEFAQALTFRPITSSNPPTMTYNAQMAYKGVPPPPSSTANTANPPYMPYKASMLTGVATEINRDLGSEIRS